MSKFIIQKPLLYVFVLLVFIVVSPACSRTKSYEVDVYIANEEGYDTYRIPALLCLPDGKLFAFAEGRRNDATDSGDIDLILKRSSDNGKTWGPVEVVWDDGINTCGNPAPVYVEEDNLLVLVMSWNLGSDTEGHINTYTSEDTRRVYITYSYDMGEKWTTPKEITQDVKYNTWSWYATGPGHAITKKLEPYKGRVIVPCNHNDTTGMSYSHIIFSDDNGITWNLGGIAPAGGNESTVAELDDGSLLLNQRKWYGVDTTTIRRHSLSYDGGLTWSENIPPLELIEPICQGSLLNYNKNNKPSSILLFSNPRTRTMRENMTITKSVDSGRFWEPQLVINPGRSIYSDMCQLPDGNIGLIYEYGDENLDYAGIKFRLITKKDLDIQ